MVHPGSRLSGTRLCIFSTYRVGMFLFSIDEEWLKFSKFFSKATEILLLLSYDDMEFG